MSDPLSPALEIQRLRRHIAWLHATLQRLGRPEPISSAIDLPGELIARRDYATRVRAVSVGTLPQAGAAASPPSMAALLAGLAALAPPVEQAPRPGRTARPDGNTAVAWCELDGTIHVAPISPHDELELANGQAHVLWHWIELLADGDGLGPWRVPGLAQAEGLPAKAAAAQRFAALLVERGMAIRSHLAAPPEHVA